MANHQRQSGNNVTCVLLTFYIVTFLSIPLPLRSLISCAAHLIHIDDEHHEFRSSGFPRPHLPPPLPPPPPEQLAPAYMSGRELTPAECMVDLTNELAFRVLHYHSILNRNNFAFSPTALMSVLVAVYEGSAGRSATELKNVLQFPNNRDIVRVGYRDIHRRLRTYFFGSDNPLKGLSLNKENVTITRDFEAILMFYGYDLGMDMVSSTAAPTTTTKGQEEKNLTTTTPSTTTTEVIKETTMAMETTPITTTTTPITTTTTPITTTTSPPTTTTTMASTNTQEAVTTLAPTTSNTVETTTEITTTQSDATTLAPTTGDTVETTTEISTTQAQTAAEETTNETTAEASTAASTPAIEAAELISSFVAEANAEPLARIQKARVTRLPSAKLQAPPQVNYLPSQRKSRRPQSTNRRKRHLFGFKDFDTNLFVSLLNSEPQLHSLAPGGAGGLHNPLAASYLQVSNEFEVDTDPNFIGSSTTAAKQNYNTDVITHVFYLSSQQVIYTTFKVYNAVLYYKYFEHLRMSVLELELDTPEYNLIILLPDYNSDLVAAASSLRSGPKLRLMRKQLKPKWVQAIIPDFKLQGTMFLTNDLQNLGICDIFEPNRADFRPMTDETGTYVKHIEQSINIHIRTHPINQVRRNTGAQAQPTQISVNHPFMFFVIDRDLDIAVMSGRILNPLNVRIQ